MVQKCLSLTSFRHYSMRCCLAAVATVRWDLCSCGQRMLIVTVFLHFRSNRERGRDVCDVCCVRRKYVTMIQWLIYRIDSQEQILKSAYTMCEQLNHSFHHSHRQPKKSNRSRSGEVGKKRKRDESQIEQQYIKSMSLCSTNDAVCSNVSCIAQKQGNVYRYFVFDLRMGVSVHLKIIFIAKARKEWPHTKERYTRM